MNILREYLVHIRLFSRDVRLFLVGSLFLGLGFSFSPVLLNLALDSAGISKSTIGDIQAATALGAMIVAPLAAILYDRTEPRLLLKLSTVLAALSASAVVFTFNPLTLMIAALVLGAAFAVHSVIAAPLLMHLTGEKERVYAFGLSFAIEIAAGVVGTFVAGAIPRLFTNRIFGIRMALFLACLFVATAVIPYGVLSKRVKNEHEPVRKTLDYFLAGDLKLYFKMILPDAIAGLGAGITIPFLNLYLKDRFSLGTEGVGTVFSAVNLCMLFGILIAPILGRRYGLLRTVAATQLLSVPFMVILALTFDARIAVLALLVRAALMNMGHPLARAFQMECVQKNEQATLNSLSMLGWNGSSILGTMLGGRIIERSGFTSSILLTSAIYVFSTLIYLAFWAHPQYLAIGQVRRDETAQEMMSISYDD